MPEYTVFLTDEQVLALEHDTEQYNAMIAGMHAMQTDMTPPTPLVPGERLNQHISQMLDGTYRNLEDKVRTAQTMLAAMPPEQHELIFSTITSPAIQAYVRAHPGGVPQSQTS